MICSSVNLLRFISGPCCGPELTSNWIKPRGQPHDLWAYQRGVILDFSRPGKPTDNSFIESFNGKLRAECLNTHWFMSLDDARVKLEDWRRDYNGTHPAGAVLRDGW
jgi:transposase InsO family protein